MTSLVSAILAFFGKLATPLTLHDFRLVHNLTQYAHCFSQGKIGSGFDVSAAVYGSQIYQRFSPEIFSGIFYDNLSIKSIIKVLTNDSTM